MRRRLEDLLWEDNVCSGSAFYGHIGDFSVENGFEVKEKDKLHTILYRDSKVVHVKTNLVHVPYEIYEFEKPSQIDRIIYEMMRKASQVRFGKIQKLKIGKDKKDYIGEYLVDDLIKAFENESNPGSCMFASNGGGHYYFPTNIKYNNIIRSEVIPEGRAILCGPPEQVGLINKAYSIDEWNKCNFAVYVGKVIVFDISSYR